jgi:hypothetical protein
MFVDLVGSTVMSARRDPEMAAVVRLDRNTVAGEIARFDGHLAKFTRDGVLAHFGGPVAHEDEAERAFRAGLAIVGSVARLQCAALGARYASYSAASNNLRCRALVPSSLGSRSKHNAIRRNGDQKSRLTQALIEAIEEQHFQYHSSSYPRDSLLFPVVQQLRHAMRISVEDTDDTKLDPALDLSEIQKALLVCG